MTTTRSVPRLIFGYAIFVTLFTTLMVGMSLMSPANFFASYNLTAEPALAYSWSFRYMVILIAMIYGLIRRNPQGIFLTILCRFFIDVFDSIAIFVYNTPPFSVGSFAFQVIALLMPEIVSLITLFRLERK